MQAGQCGSQMGTEFKEVWRVLRQQRRAARPHQRVNHKVSGGKYAPRAVFFDSGVIGAVRASPLIELFRPGNLVKHTRGQNWAKGHYKNLSSLNVLTRAQRTY
jgi:hypothetical protein